jgi:hypothetical protein
MSEGAGRPLLAVDVDGVISLFGFEELPESVPARFELVDGYVRCISVGAGERLQRLTEDFDLVWATGWEDRVSALAAILELPEWPVLTFDGEARFGTADWKLGPLADYAAGRPLAWIDDCFDERCRSWADNRAEPTLLVATQPHLGLEESHLEQLTAWAGDLR